MWLVLCPRTDSSALWAYQGLAARGLAPLELVSAEALACALHWEHRVGPGGATVAITLADGRTIRAEMVRGVLNRLVTVPPEHLLLAAPSDREYAAQELNAFYMSWLHALPAPVLNRPTAQGLSGAWRHMSEWAWLAARAGLPAAPYRQSSRDPLPEGGTTGLLAPDAPVRTVVVVGGRTCGAAPAGVLEGCRRLAALAGTPLLGVELGQGAAGPWTFAGATPLPDLRAGGEALLDALYATMTGSAEVPA